MKRRILSLFLAFCMVLGMLPVTSFAADIPDGVNFSSISNAQSITEGEAIDFTLWGMDYSAPSYTVAVPEGTETVTITFESGADVCTPYTNSSGVLKLSGCIVTHNEEDGTYSASGTESDCVNTDSVYSITLDVATMIASGQMYGGYSSSYSVLYLLNFVYGEAENTGSEAPFLSIAVDGEKLADDKIIFKTLFDLGSLESMYAYIHEDVPYYHVIVPCGTASVDVTYSADTNLFDSGCDAYGYATELEVDAVSSATVKGRTFKDAYTLNADGTQTVETPVTGYTFDENGYGMAITLEEEGGTYEAVCLFSFEYDKQNHVYADVVTAPTCTEGGYTTYTCTCGDTYIADETAATGEHSYADGKCSVCGAAEPNDVEIPDGLNIAGITEVTEITAGEEIGFTMWGMDYSGPSYVAVVPAGTETVTLTFQAGTHPTPYTSGDVLKLSGCWATWNEEDGTYVGGGVDHDCVQNEDGLYSIELDVASMIEKNRYYGAYTSGYAVQYLLGFQYEEGAHTHEYDEGVVTTEPTCTEAGVKTYTCSCGETKTEAIAATGHSYDDGVVTTEPTCTEAGVKTFTCVSCGETKTEAIAATGHSYDDGVVTTEPTCTEAGEKTFTCTSCGETKTEVVEAAGHQYDENGICAVCGESDPAPEQDENGVYQLATADDLLWFAETVNGGETGISAVLTADIDLTGMEWPGIGTSSNKFSGSFDGQGHTVTLNGGIWGLFAYTKGTSSAYAQIKNVITDGTVQNSAIAHDVIYTNVENCVNRANVTGGNAKVAGIVGSVNTNGWQGQSGATITNCANEGSITGGSNVGGILGYSQVNTQIHGCANTGSVSGTGSVGGIAGYLQEFKGTCEITDSYNQGAVSGSANDTVGGIVGNLYNGVSVSNCYNAGEAYYAVAGNVYNATASVSDTYYLDAASTEAVPASDLFESIVVTGKTHEEMRADDFAAALGESWQTSCPYPVLTWQSAAEHDYVKGVCTVCQAVDPDYVPEAEEPEQVDGVYQIGTAEELFWFAAHVNEGNTTASAVLTADIDLQNASWTSIGTSENKFAGTFDGQDHKVTNLFGTNGLFGYVEGTSDANAVIKNVTVDGTITGAADYVGGIAGSVLYTTIENCVNCADITSAYSYVGGITGGYATKSYNTITGCGNEGTIIGANRVGGIVGMNNTGLVEKCWNLGAVSGTGKTGGIAGESAGFAGTVLDNCYNKGTITGGSDYTGGIVGSDNQTLTNCYNWGTVIGENRVGGIAGYTSTVPAENCYNAGFVSGAENVGSLVGSCMVNKSTNCYYLEGTASTSADTATVKTAEEMQSADFVTTMGDAFKQGGLYPILSWQEDEAAITAYSVTIPEETGYTVMGTKLAIAGEDYCFSVTLTAGYMESEDFAVTVNGEAVTSENGVYTVPNVAEDLVIAVSGVELEPLAVFTVTLPATGNGYAVQSVDGYDAASVIANTDYKFTVEFANGFKAGEDFTVKANDVVLTAVNGVYTIEAVTEDQTITVSGVEMIPVADTVSVNLTITYGEKQFYTTEDSSEFLMLEDLEVPYFDLELYDLEKYYYNPYCYVDGSGNPAGQKVGNKETAYGVVTLIHTFIYVTEVYYLDYDPADAGKGISHQTDSDGDGVSDFAEVLNWSGGVGSSFMNLWDHGTNLNYYVNYVYPLGTESWGATSDQIALEDCDIVSVHLIEDEQVSGSNFSVFTANDDDNVFSQEDIKDTITVKQGEAVKLTLYWTGNGSNYTTIYDAVPNWTLYWSSADDVSNDMRDWTQMDQTTDSEGTVTIDTTDLEPGIYYIGSLGGKTAGGTDNGDGFISRGGETGAGVFKLVVTADGEEEPGDTTVMPAGAPFVSITTDVEGTVTVTDQGAVDFGYYSGISYYHVELPEDATEVYVTYSADTNFYLYNDAAYAYSVSVPEFEMGYASGSFATVGNDDGTRTVTIPIKKFLLTDGSGNGIALEDTNWNPVNLFTFSYAEADEEDDVLLGDVNMDGVIDTQDANLIVSYYYGSEELTEEQLKLADVDGNGIVDTQDANLIVSYYYGTIDAFPAEN